MNKNQTPISININFDSLNETYGFPKDYRDPCFFEVFDRFESFADLNNFKYTIFIIGKDLENNEFAARVKEWAAKGHEIANHTYTHPMNLGSLKPNELKDELYKAHEIIFETTGIEPKGFVAPGWSSSNQLFKILAELDYIYDSSIFPSFMLYPVMGKVALNHFKDISRFLKVINRRDWGFPFSKQRKPSIINLEVTKKNNKLVQLPLPTKSKLHLPYWHTLGFIFGYSKAENLLSWYLKNYDYFYYLMHPADLIFQDDVKNKDKHFIERLSVPDEEKNEYFNRMLTNCIKSERPILTMKEIALEILNKESKPTVQ